MTEYSNTIKPVASGSGAGSSASVSPHAAWSVTFPKWMKYGAVDNETYDWSKPVPEPPNSKSVSRINIYVDHVDNYGDVYLDGSLLGKISGAFVEKPDTHLNMTLNYLWKTSSTIRVFITNHPNGLLVSAGDKCNASNTDASSPDLDPMCKNPMGISVVKLTFFYK